MLTKDEVLREIRRAAAENGGAAPGRGAFFAGTGIRESDWSGRWWTTWGAAVREAGLEPQKLNHRLDDNIVLHAAARIVQKFGRFPTAAEIRFECHADPALPSHNTFRRFGGLGGLRTRLGTFAEEQGLSDVVAALPDHAAAPIADSPAQADSGTRALVDGFVYLIKSGRHFKIGKARSVDGKTSPWPVWATS